MTVGLAVALVYRWRLRRDVLRAIAVWDAESTGVDLSLQSLLRRSVLQSMERTQQWQRELSAWQYIAQQLPCPVLWIDGEDTMLWCNDSAQVLFNLAPDQLTQNLSFMELVRSYDLDCLIQDTRDRNQHQQRDWIFDPITALHTRVGQHPSELAQFQPQPQELLMQTPITLRGHGIAMANGHVAVMLENRQAYTDLKENRDRLANDLAHELRTPLTSIQLVFETLQGQLEPPYSQWVDRAIPELGRLVTFVQDWLALSQMEHSQQTSLNLEPLDLEELLTTVWNSLSPLAAQRSIRCNFDHAPSLWILGDPYRLHRLFQNLMDNAIKFSREDSDIQLQINLIQVPALHTLPQRPLHPRKDCLALDLTNFDPEHWSTRSDAHTLRLWVIVDVIDGGEGFKPQDLSRAFDRLYRGDPSRGRSPSASVGDGIPNGTQTTTSTLPPSKGIGGGLGLAIARRIAIAHGGNIVAANHPATRGAWLQVRFPYRCLALEHP